MGLAISNQLQLSLRIDGFEIPLGASPDLRLFINQSCRQLLPTIKINIPDVANAFGKTLPVNDGSSIEAEFNDDKRPAFQGSAVFRAFGTPHRQPSGQMMLYNMVGLLDALPYIRGNPPNSLDGTSVQVMQNVAKAMNFNYVGNVATNDQMMWRPGRKTWGTFTRHTAMHGWISDKSALATAVDEQRQLHYVDINDLFANAKVKARIIYGAGAQNATSQQVPNFVATEYRAVNRSGMLNNWHGYGLRMTQHGINGAVDKFRNITAMKLNNVLDINKDILGQLAGRARIDLPPIDTGNTHDFFLQARHHNMRSLATYSQNVYVLVPVTTGLNVFDMVELDARLGANSPDYSSSGLYCITNMTRALVNSRYCERLELTSAGPQNDNSSLA